MAKDQVMNSEDHRPATQEEYWRVLAENNIRVLDFARIVERAGTRLKK